MISGRRSGSETEKREWWCVVEHEGGMGVGREVAYDDHEWTTMVWMGMTTTWTSTLADDAEKAMVIEQGYDYSGVERVETIQHTAIVICSMAGIS